MNVFLNEAPITLPDWQYFMQSPQWALGTSMAAFDGNTLVGNVAVFCDEPASQKPGRQVGFTEYVFVRSPWRGRNIARNLINTGLAWLKEQGMTEAHLEVRAMNENALRLYVDLGYEVKRESRFYVLAVKMECEK